MKTALSLQSQLDPAGSGGRPNHIFSMLFEVLILGPFFKPSFQGVSRICHDFKTLSGPQGCPSGSKGGNQISSFSPYGLQGRQRGPQEGPKGLISRQRELISVQNRRAWEPKCAHFHRHWPQGMHSVPKGRAFHSPPKKQAIAKHGATFGAT